MLTALDGSCSADLDDFVSRRGKSTQVGDRTALMVRRTRRPWLVVTLVVAGTSFQAGPPACLSARA